MISIFKRKISLIRLLKNSIKKSLFYAVLNLLFLMILFFLLLFFIHYKTKHINKKKTILKDHTLLKTNTTGINNDQIISDNGNSINIKNTIFNKNLKHNTIKTNTINNIESEKLFQLYFCSSQYKKNNTNNQEIKNKKTPLPEQKKIKKELSKKIEKNKKVTPDETHKSKIKNIINKKTNIIKNQKISILKDSKKSTVQNNKKIDIKNEIFSTNFTKNITNRFSLNNIINQNNNRSIAPSILNDENKIDNNQIEDNKEITYTENIINNQEEVYQDELTDYIIRLKKHIRQFPGKKIELDIIILLNKSTIHEIIFPKKLFSLAYKMYIINILKKIEIPRKLWNKKLLISL